MRFSPIRWLLSPPAAVLYCLTVSALYAGRDSLGGVAALAPILSSWFLGGTIALWVLADARQRRESIPYDFGTLVFFTWPVFAPIYLFWTRRWRALIPLGCFSLLYLSAAILGRNLPLFIFSLHH